MVEFVDCEDPAPDALVSETEKRLGFPLPAALRWLFQHANGGRPVPSILTNESGKVWIDHCLPLREGKESAEWWYDLIVRRKHLVPSHWFPFALDPTGNALYVDCRSPDARVHAYLHDTAFDPHVDLGLGLQALWELDGEQPDDTGG